MPISINEKKREREKRKREREEKKEESIVIEKFSQLRLKSPALFPPASSCTPDNTQTEDLPISNPKKRGRS